MSRRSPRVRARFAASVQIAGVEHTLVCHTRDISADGCFLDTSESIAVGVSLSLALMDSERGEVVQVEGVVARRLVGDKGAKRGVGVKLIAPPPEWELMVERYQQAGASGEGDKVPIRLAILVVGDEAQRRGALALYVTSGWDVRFATDYATAEEALTGVELDAVIAEYELGDRRWNEILGLAKRLQPGARRVVRCSLAGHTPPPPGQRDDLVHRVVDRAGGVDALLDALMVGVIA
jgi:hypothetical protein